MVRSCSNKDKNTLLIQYTWKQSKAKAGELPAGALALRVVPERRSWSIHLRLMSKLTEDKTALRTLHICLCWWLSLWTSTLHADFVCPCPIEGKTELMQDFSTTLARHYLRKTKEKPRLHFKWDFILQHSSLCVQSYRVSCCCSCEKENTCGVKRFCCLIYFASVPSGGWGALAKERLFLVVAFFPPNISSCFSNYCMPSLSHTCVCIDFWLLSYLQLLISQIS